MYDDYRTVPSQQAAIRPWQHERQEGLLRALVHSPHSASTEPRAVSSGLQDLLNRSAEWATQRCNRLHAVRDARREADEATYDFQPHIAHRPNSPDRPPRSAAAYFADQLEWQQKVEQRRTALRAAQVKQSDDALAQALAEARQLREANKARVPLRAYVSPTDPTPHTDAPQPSPRHAAQSTTRGGAFVLATAVRAERRVQAEQVTLVEEIRTAASPVTKRKHVASTSPTAATPSAAAASGVASTSTPAPPVPAHVAPNSDEPPVPPVKRLSKAEEGHLVARLLDPRRCGHTSHRPHDAEEKAARTATVAPASETEAENRREAFLARQALWALRTHIRQDEARAARSADRAEVWHRVHTFAPQISPRSREMAAHFADRLEGMAQRPHTRPARYPLAQLAEGADEEEDEEVQGAVQAVAHDGPWSVAEAARAAAQIEFCDPRLNRLRQRRSHDPVRRLLRYTDKAQLRIASPPKSRPTVNSTRRLLPPVPASATTPTASPLSSSASSSSVGADVTESLDAMEDEDDAVMVSSNQIVAEGQEEAWEEEDAEREGGTAAQSWPPAPPHPPLSLARDADKSEDDSGLVSSTRYQAAPYAARPAALDPAATWWVPERPASPPVTPRWAASALWSESAEARPQPPPPRATVAARVWQTQPEDAAHPHYRAGQPSRPPLSPTSASFARQAPPQRVSPEPRAQPSPVHASVVAETAQDARLLAEWWRRLGGSCLDPAVEESAEAALWHRLPLEKVLQAMQALLDMLGAPPSARPRLGFEPSVFDLPFDVQGPIARFNVYLVLPPRHPSSPRARLTYGEPLAGAIDHVAFAKLYRWLLTAGAPAIDEPFAG